MAACKTCNLSLIIAVQQASWWSRIPVWRKNTMWLIAFIYPRALFWICLFQGHWSFTPPEFAQSTNSLKAWTRFKINAAAITLTPPHTCTQFRFPHTHITTPGHACTCRYIHWHTYTNTHMQSVCGSCSCMSSRVELCGEDLWSQPTSQPASPICMCSPGSVGFLAPHQLQMQVTEVARGRFPHIPVCESVSVRCVCMQQACVVAG